MWEEECQTSCLRRVIQTVEQLGLRLCKHRGQLAHSWTKRSFVKLSRLTYINMTLFVLLKNAHLALESTLPSFQQCTNRFHLAVFYNALSFYDRNWLAGQVHAIPVQIPHTGRPLAPPHSSMFKHSLYHMVLFQQETYFGACW